MCGCNKQVKITKAEPAKPAFAMGFANFSAMNAKLKFTTKKIIHQNTVKKFSKPSFGLVFR